MAANLHALPPVSRAEVLRQRKALVTRAKTRRANSSEARRRLGYQPPNGARIAYTAALRRLVKQTWLVVMADYADEIKRVTVKDAVREDDLRRAGSKLAGDVRVKLYELVAEKAPPIIAKVTGQVSTHNLKETKRVLGIDPRVDPGTSLALENFRRENVRLITSIAEQQLDEVEAVLAENFGLRVEALSKLLQERFSVTESRGDLIARDQTLKLNGQLTEVRQQAAGIDSYVWTTSHDERVREEHADLDGHTFLWVAPPPLGHPGEDFQCRCTPYPIVPGLDDEEA